MVRKNGEEWLITMNDTEAHIPQVYEEVKREIVIVNHWNKIRLDWIYLFIMNHENCFPRHKIKTATKIQTIKNNHMECFWCEKKSTCFCGISLCLSFEKYIWEI